MPLPAAGNLTGRWEQGWERGPLAPFLSLAPTHLQATGCVPENHWEAA